MKNEDLSSDLLREFRQQIAMHDERKKGYAGAFDLSPKFRWSVWTRKQLREAPDPPGLPCSPDELRDLTQLPEETLGWLYEVCGKKLRKTRQNPAFASHLKRLRGAIQLYFELILQKNIPIPNQPAEGLCQEGPFCFFHLLHTWAQSIGTGSADEEKRLIRMLLTISPDQKISALSILQGTWEEQFLPGTLLPVSDAQILQKCLFTVAQESKSWDFDLRKRYFTSFGASPETLSRMLAQLPAQAPPELEQEYEVLNSLSRYWTVLYPQRSRESYQGKLCFLQTLFSLLAGSLGPERLHRLPACEPRDDMVGKFLSALSQAEAPLAPPLVQMIRSQNRYADVLYSRAPSDSGWNWTRDDVACARNNPVVLQQLFLLCGEGRTVFRRTWSSQDSPSGRTRTQAAQALLQLTLDVVEQRTHIPENTPTRRDADALLIQLLACYRDSELRSYLIRLQNPGWAQLEELAAQEGMEALAQTMIQISNVSQDYIHILRLAQDLDSLESTDKLTLAALADDAEQRLELCREGIDTMADTGDIHPTSLTLCSAKEMPLCPVWDGQPDHDYMRPYVSSAFDSLRGFGAAEIQLQLASILLRSGQVILTPPQLADNPYLLELALHNAAFLELLRCGSVTLSFFRSYSSLREYAIQSLEDDSFRFSGYRVFQGDEETERKYLRFCMASYLRASDENGRKAALRKAPFEFWTALSQYGSAIRLVDEALEQQYCGGSFGTLNRLFHQVSGWRKDCLRSGLLARIEAYLRRLPHHPELMALHQFLMKMLPPNATRSVIYKALDESGQQGWDKSAVEAYRTVADWMYFEENSTCITPFKEHRVEQKFQDLVPTNQQNEKLSFHISYKQTSSEPGSSMLDLEDIVRFVRESRKWVANNHDASSAAAILWGTLDQDRSVRITQSQSGICYLEHLALKVASAECEHVLLQEVGEHGNFVQMEHRD